MSSLDLHLQPNTWSASKSRCSSLGGNLIRLNGIDSYVSLLSALQDDWVDHLSIGANIWVDIHRNETLDDSNFVNKLVTESNEHGFTSTNLCPSLQSSNGSLEFKNCNARYPYVCNYSSVEEEGFNLCYFKWTGLTVDFNYMVSFRNSSFDSCKLACATQIHNGFQCNGVYWPEGSTNNEQPCLLRYSTAWLEYPKRSYLKSSRMDFWRRTCFLVEEFVPTTTLTAETASHTPFIQHVQSSISDTIFTSAMTTSFLTNHYKTHTMTLIPNIEKPITKTLYRQSIVISAATVSTYKHITTLADFGYSMINSSIVIQFLKNTTIPPNPSENRISPTSTYNSGYHVKEQFCRCYDSNINTTTLELETQEMLDNLKVDKSNTTLKRNRYISSYDPRQSAKAIGYIGVVVFVLLIGGIVLLDIVPSGRKFDNVR